VVFYDEIIEKVPNNCCMHTQVSSSIEAYNDSFQTEQDIKTEDYQNYDNIERFLICLFCSF
jgi:hypothetical protein